MNQFGNEFHCERQHRHQRGHRKPKNFFRLCFEIHFILFLRFMS